jgi:hypothetical protein
MAYGSNIIAGAKTQYNIHIQLEKIHVTQYHKIKSQSASRAQGIIRYSRNDRSPHPLGVV